MVQQLSTNTFGVSEWVVSADSTQGTHTTIAAAITSAAAGDIIYIRQGDYTEDLTVSKKLIFRGEGLLRGGGAPTKIIGKIEISASVACSFQDLGFIQNSDTVIDLPNNTTTVRFFNCFMSTVSGQTLIDWAGTGNTVYLNDCNLTGTNSGKIFNMSSNGGTLFVDYCRIQAGDATASTFGAGGVEFAYSNLTLASSFTSTSTGKFKDCSVTSPTVTSVTTADTASVICRGCFFSPTTASALSIGTGTTIETYRNTIESSNTNAITGAGTNKMDATTFTSSSSLNNTTTKSFVNFGDRGTFTPVIKFGGGVVGITYGTQRGEFVRIGNLTYIYCIITLTSKGTSTGSAIVSGFPFNGITNQNFPIDFRLGVITFTSTSQLQARLLNNGLYLSQVAAATGADTVLTDANYADTSTIIFAGSYLNA